ncbi:OsmC family protein [Ligilactobacillus araffinosus]|uniref:OsmC family protein n=1 Tax=Ligilactobacillus araffinosus DSM 20653 TaxID=1423820 RepID=A0A0R1ZJ82_9LACO|nr:OsmC family protein [Ligilactobacillus araffinosus]KRM51995.1 hypothetical protein FC64_GL001189 [Ligilactobacillus araffinosus DSM 20653]
MRSMKVVSTKNDDGYEVTNDTGEFVFKCDEPEKLGGSNKYPRPIDYLLGALGSCLNITARSLAKRKGIKISTLTITIIGNIESRKIDNQRVKKQITSIQIKFEMKSDLPRIREEHFFQECVTTCPVHALIENQTKITWSY